MTNNNSPKNPQTAGIKPFIIYIGRNKQGVQHRLEMFCAENGIKSLADLLRADISEFRDEDKRTILEAEKVFGVDKWTKLVKRDEEQSGKLEQEIVELTQKNYGKISLKFNKGLGCLVVSTFERLYGEIFVFDSGRLTEDCSYQSMKKPIIRTMVFQTDFRSDAITSPTSSLFKFKALTKPKNGALSAKLCWDFRINTADGIKGKLIYPDDEVLRMELRNTYQTNVYVPPEKSISDAIWNSAVWICERISEKEKTNDKLKDSALVISTSIEDYLFERYLSVGYSKALH